MARKIAAITKIVCTMPSVTGNTSGANPQRYRPLPTAKIALITPMTPSKINTPAIMFRIPANCRLPSLFHLYLLVKSTTLAERRDYNRSARKQSNDP